MNRKVISECGSAIYVQRWSACAVFIVNDQRRYIIVLRPAVVLGYVRYGADTADLARVSFFNSKSIWVLFNETLLA